MCLGVNRNSKVSVNDFGPVQQNEEIIDTHVNPQPERVDPNAVDDGQMPENPASKKDIAAHAAFIDRLFEKAVETNKGHVTLKAGELSDVDKQRPLDAKTFAAAEEAREMAEWAMAGLDGYTGRQLVMAFRGKDFQQSTVGMTFFKAVDAQLELAEKLSDCSRSSGGVTALEEMALQAKLRAAELSRLLGELSQIYDGNSEDARLDAYNMTSELSRIGAESNGNREAIAFLESKLGLAELDAFSSEDKDLTPKQVADLRAKIGELKAKVEDARKNGIDFSRDGNCTMVDPSVFTAIRDELARMEERLDGHDKKFVSAALMHFADEIRPPDFVIDLATYAKTAWKHPDADETVVLLNLRAICNTYAQARQELMGLIETSRKKGEVPDGKVFWEVRNRFDANLRRRVVSFCAHFANMDRAKRPDSFKTYLSETSTGHMKLQEDEVKKAAFAPYHNVVDVVEDALRHWSKKNAQELDLRKEDLRAFLYTGKVSINDHIEARVHGLSDSAVDAEVSGLVPESTKILGAGACSTATLCTFKVGSKELQRVFKPESTAHGGINHGARKRLSGKLKFQKTVTFNMATRKVSQLLGAEERNMDAKIGSFKRRFGMFLEVVPGVSPGDVWDGGKESFHPDGTPIRDLIDMNQWVLRSKNELAKNLSNLYQNGGEVARQLNELQWLDVITGQLDRHNHNFHVFISDNFISETQNIRVCGIDNDASFPEDIHEVGTIAVNAKQTKSFVEYFEAETNSKDFRNYFTSDDGQPLVLGDDESGYTFNYQDMTPEQRAMLMKCTGIRCGAMPSVVDHDMADKIDKFVNTPEERIKFKAELKACGLSDKQIDAAMDRLVSADRAIKEGKVKVIETKGWSDVAKEKMIDPDGKPIKRNKISGIVCDDYFMRDEIRALFTGLASRGK